jgi:hypothetical protein
MTDTNKKMGQQARNSVENALEVALEERRKKLLNHRIDLARSGIAAYKKGAMVEAVRAFHQYLRIVEEIKDVIEGGLTPTHFDMKSELPEVLMISGIYWDLVKIYDRTKSASSQREFFHFMEKYIAFSRGMPFQPVCAESLRKYIQNEKPFHRTEFKNAYHILSISKCFIATSLVDVTQSATLPTLRKFRDQVLKKSKLGRQFVALYYRHAPPIAERVNLWPHSIRFLLGKGLDFFSLLVSFTLVKQCTNSLRSKDKLTVRKTHPKG